MLKAMLKLQIFKRFHYWCWRNNLWKKSRKISTKGKSLAKTKHITVNAEEFEYDKNSNILNAKGNVKVIDSLKDFTIDAEEITYEKNLEKISTKGLTKANFDSKYKLETNDLVFLNNVMEVSSINSATILTNKNRSYEFENFKYYINKKLLKANNVYINENILLKKVKLIICTFGMVSLI